MARPFLQRKLALAFYAFDLTKDGLISQDDFEMFAKITAKDLGHEEGSDAYNKLRAIWIKCWEAFGKPADIDGSGDVTLAEWLRVNMHFMYLPIAKETLITYNSGIFDAMDANGNGSLSRREYAAFLKPYGLTAEEASIAFDKLDRDGSGVITRKEFAENAAEFFGSDDPQALGNWMIGRF
jgi:Ca2+-binding EF-hand superfamily protein